MANNYKKTRTTTDKVSVKGILSDDGTMITYKDENKTEKEIAVADCLDIFKGDAIDFSITRKSEEDLLNDQE